MSHVLRGQRREAAVAVWQRDMVVSADNKTAEDLIEAKK
jgi:hypothetical protein